MKIGITGTRSGMTDEQCEMLANFLKQAGSGEFHHGDCVGVDVEAATIAQDLGFKTINHPPTKTDLRAYHKSDEIREPKSYFARNRDIVNETECIIVIPFQTAHQSFGGTWYTHDYAIKQSKPVHVFYPVKKREDINPDLVQVKYSRIGMNNV